MTNIFRQIDAEPAPPKLGEIRSAREIRRGEKGRYQKYIWAACENCGKQRWVHYVRGQPVYKRCPSCASLGNKKRWKGGRAQASGGYILIKLYPDDFFYSMTNKRGYVSEHRLVVAKRLGRCLHPWELVHHKDHIRDHNDDDNLQLVSDDRHMQITILEKRITALEQKGEEQAKLIKLLRWQIKEFSKKDNSVT